jgi:hypothetical protein
MLRSNENAVAQETERLVTARCGWKVVSVPDISREVNLPILVLYRGECKNAPNVLYSIAKHSCENQLLRELQNKCGGIELHAVDIALTLLQSKYMKQVSQRALYTA